ncbi:MAG: hypothetical protein ACPL3B_01985 [Fervidobacterium sp.]
MWWSNLEKNYFIEDGIVYVDKNLLRTLLLMILCAEGKVYRTKEDYLKKKFKRHTVNVK